MNKFLNTIYVYLSTPSKVDHLAHDLLRLNVKRHDMERNLLNLSWKEIS
jgi:hypothetical protein